MHMRMSESIKEIASALAKFQGEVNNPTNTAINPQFRSKYAPLDVVIKTVKPVLAKYGLSFVQSVGTQGENVVVTTLLLHESGEWIESDPLVLPAYQNKKGGEKEFNAQAAGSSTTYARRYSLSAMLGISSEDDDDANAQVFGDNQDTAEPVLSAEEKERRRQEAIARARARAGGATTPTIYTDEDSSAKRERAILPTEGAVDNTQNEENEAPNKAATPETLPITPQQEKAIQNLLNVLAKKRGDGFDKDAFLQQILAEKLGLSELSQATFEQGRAIIAEINTELRK